jgi:putative inorganic carbon (hco3(-)) transporter
MHSKTKLLNRSSLVHLVEVGSEKPSPINITDASVINNLYSLSLSDIYGQIKIQGFAFWMLCLYLVFEYMRPQTIWPVIDIAPWGKMVLIGAAIGLTLSPRGRGGMRSIATFWMILFQVVILLSSIDAYNSVESFSWFYLFFSWLVVYYLIINVVDTRIRFYIFILLYFLMNLKMSQHGFISWVQNGFGFSSWGVVCGPGWFNNSGECGTQMAMVFPMFVYFIVALRHLWSKHIRIAMWFLPLTALGTVIASSSRGSLVALMGACTVMILKSKKPMRAIIAVTAMALVVWSVTPPEFKQRFDTAGKDTTSQTRLLYWKHGLEIIETYPYLGVGYKNWGLYYSDNWPEDTPYQGVELPHNIFLEIGAELGWTGLLVYFFLIFYTFSCNAKSRQLACKIDDRFLLYTAHGLDVALVAYLISGQFVSIAYYPFFWVNLAMTVALRKIAEATIQAPLPTSQLGR